VTFDQVKTALCWWKSCSIAGGVDLSACGNNFDSSTQGGARRDREVFDEDKKELPVMISAAGLDARRNAYFWQTTEPLMRLKHVKPLSVG